jgi:pantothenate synthetase
VIDYVSIADPESLEELDVVRADGALVLAAARFGATRLLDNVRLGGEAVDDQGTPRVAS